MPNVNVVEFAQGSGGQGPYSIPAIVPASTSAFVVTNQLGSAAVLSLSNGAPSAAAVQPSYASGWDGSPFRIRIFGKVTTKASCNLTVAILCQTSTTYASGNVVATTGAKAVNTASGTFMLYCDVQWDSITAALQGTLGGQVANSLVTGAALTNSVAVTTAAGLTFCPALTFSDTTAGTELSITGFQIEEI